MIVEVSAVMNALNQIGAAEGYLQDLGCLCVDLNLITVVAPHLDHALVGPYVQPVNIFPSFNPRLGDAAHYFENTIKADGRLCPHAALGGRLDVGRNFLQLQDNAGHDDDRDRQEGNDGSPPMRQAVELGELHVEGYFASSCFICCISFAWRTKTLRPWVPATRSPVPAWTSRSCTAQVGSVLQSECHVCPLSVEQ